MDGICTLANDVVCDQLLALLNSLEANLAEPLPVCVYPYDNNTEKIAAEIARRSNVCLYENGDSIEKWDSFVKAIWDLHPTASQRWRKIGSEGYHRIGTHRRYCAFDAPFDRFLYMDADTLLMAPIEPIFSQLANHECVVYDFQYKDPNHVYELSSTKLKEVFSQTRIESEIFCSGFYASRKDLFNEQQRNWLLACLKKEAEVLYPMAPDQTIVNYMMMRSGYSIYNFALDLPKSKRTGCCVTSPHFQARDNILYDGGNPLTYLHYIGLRSRLFSRVCAGENIDFPYRDIFLHYRFLHEPEKRPKFTDKPKPYQQPKNLTRRMFKKLGLPI
jgi:hypothetical protein